MTNASEGEGPTGSDKRSASTGNANERWQRQTTRSKGVMITCAIAKRSLHTLARFELSRRRQKSKTSHTWLRGTRFRERSKITLKAGEPSVGHGHEHGRTRTASRDAGGQGHADAGKAGDGGHDDDDDECVWDYGDRL